MPLRAAVLDPRINLIHGDFHCSPGAHQKKKPSYPPVIADVLGPLIPASRWARHTLRPIGRYHQEAGVA